MSEQPLEMPPPLPAHVSMDASEVSAPPRVAPPTVAGKLGAPARAPTWHIALGILLLVLAIGSLATSGVAALVVAESGGGWHTAAGWRPGSLELFGLFCGSGALAIALIVISVFLAMRRPWTRRALLVWAPLKVAVAVCIFVPSLAELGESAERVVFAMIPLAWACFWPCFMVIWLMRKPVRETVGLWKSPAGRAVL